MLAGLGVLAGLSLLGWAWFWKQSGFAVVPTWLLMMLIWRFSCYTGIEKPPVFELWVNGIALAIVAILPWIIKIGGQYERRKETARAAASLQAMGVDMLKDRRTG